MDEQGTLDVLERDGERVAVDFMFGIVENEIAVAVGKCDFEAGLHVETGAPARIFLGSCGGAHVEGGPFRISVSGGEIGIARDVAAPEDVLESALFVDAKDVGSFGGVEDEDFLLIEEADGSRGLGASGDRENQQKKREKKSAKEGGHRKAPGEANVYSA